MKIVTHDSRFHADDVFAVATLLLLVGEAEVVRSRDPEAQVGADYMVDTGMQYDPSRKLFDHHQPEGAGVRDNGIPYASFGLVWKEYGEKVVGDKVAADIIEKKLVQPIDAHDNGVAVAESKFKGIKEYTIGDFLYSLATSRETEALYAAFMQGVNIAKDLLIREIKLVQKAVADQDKVLSYYNKSTDKRLVIMEEDLAGWKELLTQQPGVLYVVYPRPDGKWSIAAIQDEHYISRKKLPEAWAGKTNEELEKVTGVSGALFCHRALFMGAAKTKEAAIQLAEIALNA